MPAGGLPVEVCCKTYVVPVHDDESAFCPMQDESLETQFSFEAVVKSYWFPSE